MAFTFYDRKYALSLGGGDPISQLQITFDVALTGSAEPNTLDLTITNLKETTRSQITKGLLVDLAFGWSGGDVSTAFIGTIRTVSHQRDGANWITTIHCADGDIATRKHATLTFGAGTGLKQVAHALASETGLDIGDLADKMDAKGAKNGLRDFARGFVSSGRPLDELIKLGKSIGLNVSVQEGKIVALEDKETIPGVIELSPTSGLIGSPEPGEEGRIRCTSLLYPLIKPGRRVNLTSQAITGEYKAVKVNHVGDYRGGDWYTQAELKGL